MRNDAVGRRWGGEDPARRLSNGFLALVVFTSGLIVLGALVRAHGAGLACPDWPRCYGAWVPPGGDFGIAIEVSHRVLAACVGISFAVLALLTVLRVRTAERRRRAVAALVVGALLLAIQVVLGGLTVLLGLAPWTVTAHLLVGNATNASFLWVALVLRDERERRSPLPRPPGWALALTLLLLFTTLQLGLGGTLAARGAGLACPAWPTCDGVSFFPSWRGGVGLHVAHRTVGYALLPMAGILVWTARRGGALRGVAVSLLAAILVQIGVGVANVAGGLPVAVTALHSALAAVLVMLLTHAAWETLSLSQR